MASKPSGSPSSSRAAKAPAGRKTATVAPLGRETPASTLNRWTFLTNHSHVLILLSRNPSVVLREVAQQVGITERAVQRIIADLEAEGVIERERVGRQNHYKIITDLPLRHPVEAHRTIGDLLSLIGE